MTTGASVRAKDFLSVLDFEPSELEACLSLAARLKRDRSFGPKAPTAHALAGAHVALLFDKPSLRTRSTFEIAVRELGGNVITPFPDVALGEREPAIDVARNLGLSHSRIVLTEWSLQDGRRRADFLFIAFAHPVNVPGKR